MSLATKFDVLAVPLYVPGTTSEEDARLPVKLGSNEAALGTSPRALEAYHAAAAEAFRYPDAIGMDIKQALVSATAPHARQFVLGAGSESLIHLLARAYAGPGDDVVMTQYGFQLYRIAGLCTGAKVVLADDSPNLTASVDNILAAVTPRTRIVFLANPNNPTGTLISAAEVRRLVAGLPGSVLLVLDAAYMHYVDDPAYSSGTELIGEGRKNVVVLGTFSKAFGLAGLRLGWAYCPPEIVGVLDRIRPTFGVPVPALRAGLVALEDTAHVAREVAHVRAQRPVLEAGLRRLGLRVIPGTANFTLARMPRADQPADALVAHLRTAGILVRPVKNYALADSLRITIGTQAEIAAVLAAVAAFPGLHGDIARRVGT